MVWTTSDDLQRRSARTRSHDSTQACAGLPHTRFEHRRPYVTLVRRPTTRQQSLVRAECAGPQWRLRRTRCHGNVRLTRAQSPLQRRSMAASAGSGGDGAPEGGTPVGQTTRAAAASIRAVVRAWNVVTTSSLDDVAALCNATLAASDGPGKVLPAKARALAADAVAARQAARSEAIMLAQAKLVALFGALRAACTSLTSMCFEKSRAAGVPSPELVGELRHATTR